MPFCELSCKISEKGDVSSEFILVGEICQKKTFALVNLGPQSRVEICRDRHNRRSCKICASCVNFSGKQRDLWHNLRRNARFTHTKCDFALEFLKFYTVR